MYTLSLSYVPLIAPSTSFARIRFLSSIADSFIYVVSKVCVSLIQIAPLTISKDGNDRIYKRRRSQH
jgi:tryptophan synthase alpha subunit